MGHATIDSSEHADAENIGTLPASTQGNATSYVNQSPLLPESLPAGIIIASAQRNLAELRNFFGTEQFTVPERVESLEEVVSKFCMLVVSDTFLVHYTKRPKANAKALHSKTFDANQVHAEAESERQPTSGNIGDSTASNPIDEKYWKRRYNYFSRFDEGIRMDVGAWFEVTPESVARHIADRMPYDLVVDGTCGVGGNAIQFAMTSKRVIAVDMDASRLRDAAHNASIYGVQDRIDFVCDDFANFASTYNGRPIDAVFLSPPWGGPAHLDASSFSLKDVTCPDIVHLFAAAAAVSRRVVLYLPRHQDLNEIVLLASSNGFGSCEIEKVFFEYPTPHIKLVVVYFSNEVATAPLRPATGLKKKVGPTGGHSRLRNSATIKYHGVSVKNGTALWNLPPLVGPIVRALTCRFHYVGRFIVAAALAAERNQACTLAHQDNALDARSGKMLRKQTAQALYKALVPLDAGQGGDEELQACLEWLLCEVAVLDVMKLIEDAFATHKDATSPQDASAAFRIFEKLKLSKPDVHQQLVAWRKAGALKVVTSAT